MAIGTKDGFKLYDREFFGGMNEVLQQNTEVFNGASGGAVRLVTSSLRGNFERESFMKKVTGGTVTHRDITSTSTVTPNKMEQGELVAPKINRRIGPNSNTMDAWKKIEEDPQMFSFYYGQQIAEDVAADWLNTLVLAGVTCMETETGMVYDATGEPDPKLRTEYLVRGLKKLGDKAQRVRAWVMHSNTFYDLVEADGVSTGVDAYKVLGLTDEALVATQSEDQNILSDTELGRENIVMTIQGEYAFNTRVKGFSYTAATINPDNAALGTGSNWGYAHGDVKLGPGVLIRVA